MPHLQLRLCLGLCDCFHQARIKAQLKKDGAAKLPPGGLTKLIHEDSGYMAGERTFLNMLEQMPVFLASFAGYAHRSDAAARQS